MTTIEEAYGAVDKAVSAYVVAAAEDALTGGDAKHSLAVRLSLRSAVRAVAEAVLDKAVVGARYTLNSKAKWIVELRQQIQELGK